MKKILSLILLALLPLVASAEVVEINGIYYNFDSGAKTAEVTSNPNDYYYYSGSVNIPSSVTYEGNKFSVTSIGRYAFWACRSMTSVTIPNSVTTIESGAFYNCSGMTSVTIPNSVTSIGDNAFSYCDGLTSVNIGNSVTSIGESAFWGCSGLTSVTIPNSVTSIGEYAFYFTGLTSVTIPQTVTNIGTGAFAGCSGMTVETGNTTYDSRNDCNAIIETATNKLIAGCQNTVIPNSVISIGESAFVECRSLTSITIPNSVIDIDDWAFMYCSRLTSITIPSSVKSIGNDAFFGCGLTSITIPNSVANIGLEAFGGCDNLTSIKVETGNSTYDSRNNCNAIIETATNTLVVGCKNTIIPESVTSIGRCAFRNCYGLTSINIPESVTTIDDGAFKYCYNLTSVTIGNHVTSIGDEAFKDCGGLTYIAIPHSVTYIGKEAFEGCYNLISIDVPNRVTNIGESAFYSCEGLTSVNITDLSAWCNIKFEGDRANPLLYAHHLYLNGKEIKVLTIPNDVASVGNYAFYGCEGLNSVNIPESVTSIGDYAFRECSRLTSVTIPNSVATIGQYAFYGCESLTDVYCYATEPPIIAYYYSEYSDRYYYNSFNTSYIKYVTLHVPEESIYLYKEVEPWKYFGTIVALTDNDPKPDPDAIEDVKVEDVTEMDYFDLNGRKLNAPQKGINIIRYSDGTTRKVAIK